jgi:hypothetical protein
VSAMVFMEDSSRAADMAKKEGMDVGLHLNFNEEFTGYDCPGNIREDQRRTKRFLDANRYSEILFHPFLVRPFRNLYRGQLEEFVRLYGGVPSHIDGHRHMHLCANVLLGGLIPRGERVRRSFYFPPGEKSFWNRAYRNIVNRWLSRRYKTTDYFFDLTQLLENGHLGRLARLATNHVIELNTHPRRASQSDYLLSDAYLDLLAGIKTVSYSMI